MFGKLKRRWRRFIFYERVHHPVFFRVLDFFTFPIQLALLVGTLWALVGWYISFTEKTPRPRPITEQLVQTPPSNTPAQTTTSAPSTVSNNNSLAASTDALNTIKIISAEKKEADSATQPAISTPSQRSSQIPKSLPVAAIERTTSIVGADWLLDQDKGFVVQISTSTRPAKLRALAQEIGSVAPVAIYPFTTTETGEQLYGLSVGHYSNYQAASVGFKKMPQAVQSFKPWIRSVRELQKIVSATMTPDTTNLAGVE